MRRFLDMILAKTALASTVVPLPNACVCGGAAKGRPLIFRGAALSALMGAPRRALAFGALTFAAFAFFAAPVAAQNGPLTLEECVAMALQSNLKIEIAAEKLAEMDAAIDEAHTARMPKLSSQASYTRLIPAPSTSVPEGINFQTGQFVVSEKKVGADRFNIGLTATQPLYTGGKITNAKKIAEHGKVATEWQQKSTRREIRRDVTKAYYQALAATKGIVALDSAIALMEVMLKDLGNAVEVGMRGEHELLQAQVQLSSQKLSRQQVVTGAQAARDYLATLIGVPVAASVTLVDELHAPESFNAQQLADLQKRAREASTDLKALEAQMKIIETSLLITGTSILQPTVFLQAGYTGEGATDGDIKESGKWSNSGRVTLGAQWDIYDFGAANSKRRQTLSQKRQLELNMEYLRVNLDMLVKNDYASLLDAYAGIETGRESVEQAKRSYEISYDKFQEGMMLSSEVLNAQNVTLQAEISYYSSLSNYYMMQAELDYLVNEEK